MKNVYSIGAYQLDQEGFRLDLLYNNPETSLLVPFFPLSGVDDRQIVTLLEMDKINQNNQPLSDGVDFMPLNFEVKRFKMEQLTSKWTNLLFNSCPFGKTFKDKLQVTGSQVTIDKVVFNEL